LETENRLLKTRDHIVVGIISIVLTLNIKLFFTGNLVSTIIASFLIVYAWNFFQHYAFARKLQEDNKRRW